MKMYYIYLTTNLINNKKYIGMHHGELNDNYLGSGNSITEAIKKYGKENFKRIILHISKNYEDNCQWEKFYIEKYNAVADKNFYNIHEGGSGGNTRAGWSKEQLEQYKKERSLASMGEKNPRYGTHLSEETKQKIRENRNTEYMKTGLYRKNMSLAVSGEKNGMYGKKHTEESKQKMSEHKKGKKMNSENGNAKKIIAYEDIQHQKKVKEFDCIKEALIWIGTKPTDYSGISKSIKLNRPYKGFYWIKECRD